MEIVRIVIRDRRHVANPNATPRIDPTEGVDQLTVVASKGRVVGCPIHRIYIVQSEVNNDVIRGKSKGALTLVLKTVGRATAMHEGGAIAAEIAHVERIAEQLLQLCGISVGGRIRQTIAIGYAVAHACDLDPLADYRGKARNHDQGNYQFGHIVRNGKR